MSVRTHEARLGLLEGAYTQVRDRLGGLDRSFDDLARSFAQLRTELDIRFGQIDRRFEQIDARFGQLDARFGQIDTRFNWLIGIVFSSWLSLAALILLRH